MITCEHCGKKYPNGITPLHCRCGGVTGYVHEPPTVEYNHWAPLHYYAVKNAANWNELDAIQFYKQWEKNIPNSKSCSCKSNWLELELEPDFSSAKAFFDWAWLAHDTVSSKVEAERGSTVLRPTLSEAYELWRFACSEIPSIPTPLEAGKGLPALSKHASTFEQFNV
jgi:hypothetical protein